MILSLTLAGCWGDVGNSFKIDSGVEPRYQDRDVRFRTTYYFRVFDICDVLDEDRRMLDYAPVGNTFTKRVKGRYKILNDSLYRFRMTGKASAAFQDIVFESGTLRAEQIDPFGSSIDFDEKTRKFQLRSASDNREIQQRSDVHAEVERLLKLLDKFPGENHPNAKVKIENLILEQLESLATKGSVGRSASLAVEVATTKESVLAVIENLKQEPVLVDVQRLDTVLQKLTQENDNVFTATDDLNKSIDPLIKSSRELLAVIETAINKETIKKNEHPDSGPSGEKPAKTLAPLTQAVEDRKEAAAKVQTAEQDKKVAVSEKGKAEQNKIAVPDKFALPENPITKLEEAKKELIEKSDELNDKRQKLLKLTESKNKVEGEIKNLKRAKGMLYPSTDKPDLTVSTSDSTCADGIPSRRGFQVLGPEGFRSFDPDERLVMALSINSKPLISALQQFSDQRVKGGPTNTSAESIKTERERLGSTRQALDQLRKTLDPDGDKGKSLTSSDIRTTVLGAFNKQNSNSHNGQQ